MWIIAGLAGLMMLYGVYTAIAGQLEYNDLSDQIADSVKRREMFTQQFPTTDVDGEIRPDLTGASQSDLMFIAMLRRDENNAAAQRVDADNQRRTGVRLIGMGVIGLALAYLVWPDSKPPALPEGAAAAPNTSEDAASK